MGKKYDPADIPDVGISLATGRYLFSIASLDDSQATSTGKYMIKTELRVIEPSVLANQPHFHQFVIGTDTDPEADEKASWQGFAARLYRQMALKAGFELTGDIEVDRETLVGQRVGALIQQSAQAATNRDGTPNQYAGRMQSQIQSFFHEGERETGVESDNGARAVAKQTAPAVKPQPVPAAKPAAAPAAKPAGKPATASMKCTFCNALIPRGEFAAHVGKHVAEGTDEE